MAVSQGETHVFLLVMVRVGCGWSRLAGMPRGAIGVGWSAWGGVRVMCVAHDRPSLQVVDLKVTAVHLRHTRSTQRNPAPLYRLLDRIPRGGGLLGYVRGRVCIPNCAHCVWSCLSSDCHATLTPATPISPIACFLTNLLALPCVITDSTLHRPSIHPKYYPTLPRHRHQTS
jgi:hypothetical protein